MMINKNIFADDDAVLFGFNFALLIHVVLIVRVLCLFSIANSCFPQSCDRAA
jgi:hypothetical protein